MDSQFCENSDKVRCIFKIPQDITEITDLNLKILSGYSFYKFRQKMF